MALRFEWDEEKAAANVRKHGVSFLIARRVFADPLALTELNSVEHGEYRWQTLGAAAEVLLLLVIHADRNEDDEEVIRIISAREATPREKRRYGQNRPI